jgi:hypothetical protein
MSRITDGTVQGQCPACGHEVLILGEGGYVTCSLMDCPDPEAATKMLEKIPDMNPTVGRTVHYVSHGTPLLPDGTQAYTAQCRAAIVTAVEDPAGDAGGGIVSLCVLNPTGLFFNEHIPHVDAGQQVGGSWHWLERAE